MDAGEREALEIELRRTYDTGDLRAVATLAIREPGDYRVTVRWSDGLEKTLPVTLAPNQLTAVRAARPTP